MMNIFRVLACVAVAGAIASAGVVAPVGAAQPDPVNGTSGETNEANDCTEQIDRSTILCSAELDGSTAILVLESERRQSVTLTDAGAFSTGGEVNRKSVRLHEGRNTVRLDVTIDGGSAGVAVDTGSVLYAVPVAKPLVFVGGPWSASDVQLAGAAAALSVAVVIALMVLRTVVGRSGQPERVA